MYGDDVAAPSGLQLAWRAIRREGIWYMVRLALLWAFLPLIRAWHRSFGIGFHFAGERYEYFLARYNVTANSERAVEIPIVWRRVQRAAGARVLEVGHVLGHYFDVTHEVVDKYERAAGVRNEDVTELAGGGFYDLIVSISTLEHVGLDEIPRDLGKVDRAIEALAARLVSPGGRLLVTFPLGANPRLDALLQARTLPFEQVRFLRRVGILRWVEATFEEVRGSRYNRPYPFGNAIAVCERSAALRGSIAAAS